jgi:membrane associated rhomboid family serine protease
MAGVIDRVAISKTSPVPIWGTVVGANGVLFGVIVAFAFMFPKC